MKTFIIVLFVFFQIINSKAKVYSWLPLDSLEKSPLNLKLSDNRFIPSTKIWKILYYKIKQQPLQDTFHKGCLFSEA